MREILEHLLEREIFDRQKRAFWQRFPLESKLRIFTGALRNNEWKREMLGDWDVRTALELSSYLPTVHEAMAIELVTPLSSPAQAYDRQKVRTQQDISPDKFLEEYLQEIETLLRDTNAIIIASPEVNPIAEYLLHKIYDVEKPAKPFGKCETSFFNGYVVVKEIIQVDTSETDDFPGLFYRSIPLQENKIPRRGFASHIGSSLVRNDNLMEVYKSQDESTEDFFLLGQLVIARYPPKRDSVNFVVLLNGVSGPSTFALAQILTGGGGVFEPQPDMPSDSEQMLAKINALLDQESCIGVQAIVKVHIVPATGISNINQILCVDSRQVFKWEFAKPPEPIMRFEP